LKFIDRSYLLVNMINEENDRYLIIKTFNAFKYNNYLDKYIKAKHTLNQENEKKRDCEEKLKKLIEINQEKVKIQCFRR
jgi:hypothetical protein